MKYIKLTLLLLTIISFTNCSTTSDSEGGEVIPLPTIPSVVTSDVTDITLESAASGGSVTSDGDSPVTARGVVWGVQPNPTILLATKTSDGTGMGDFDSVLPNLNSNTSYYVRAYATNEYGTAYGNQLSFTTPVNPDDLPNVNTTAITEVTTNSALSGGNVTNVGASPVSSRGVVWSINPDPTILINTGFSINGNNGGVFTSSLTDLLPDTTYYIKAYATNSQGTGYGVELSFTTSPLLYTLGTGVTDIDGNNYNSVIVNSQEWTTTNLNVTKYRNGDVIPQVQDAALWATLTTGAWCYYANQTSNGTVYGKLYNWYAVHDPRGIAPLGWHVPTNSDWISLTTFLGGVGMAGGLIKEQGTSHWQSPNTGAVNSTGITALPGGNCLPGGSFSGLGTLGYWWISDEYNPTSAWCAGLLNTEKSISRAPINKKYGFSIRVIKD